MEKTAMHPCFDIKAKTKYARVHLPVAPKCNVQCNYCNRKYDCVNESRPGVTSEVLTPDEAVRYIDKLVERIPALSTVGIAGPGDSFAEPQRTLDSIRKIRDKHPELIFCVSTNGLDVIDYIDEMKALGVEHITLTINSLNPVVLAEIYQWVRYKKRMYRGLEAGVLMAERQSEALFRLCSEGFKVKVNTVVVPGVNDADVAIVAERAAEAGAFVMNCIPLIPAKGSAFEDKKSPGHDQMKEIREVVSKHIRPMTHCARCRADAAGFLGKDEDVFKLIQECKALPVPSADEKPYVAVATHEGLLVNRHLGETDELYIYQVNGDQYELKEVRKAPTRGQGDIRWIKLASALRDCRYVLVEGVGNRPTEILQQAGIAVVEMSGLIGDGLDAVYKGRKVYTVVKPGHASCRKGECGGNGMGCG